MTRSAAGGRRRGRPARHAASSRLGRGRAPRRGSGHDPRPGLRRGARRPARRDRGPHGQVPRPPLGRAARPVRGAGGARLVLAAGRGPGGGGDAGHARVPVERGHLLRHAAHHPGRLALRVRVHERGLPSGQREVRVRGHHRRGARAGPRGRRDTRVRMPGRLRHGADGLDRRPLRRSAHRGRRGGCGQRAQAGRAGTAGTRAVGPRLPAALGGRRRGGRPPRPTRGARRASGRRHLEGS